MARDYKHRSRSSRPAGAPGWQWLAAGFALGLTVALAVYLYDRRPGGIAYAARERPVAAVVGKEAPDAEAPAGERFDFYDLLPKFEVVIPEQDRDVRSNAEQTRVEQPGAYVLQAGSFRAPADADRVRATLALQGIESRIQQVTIDADTWHRVRIGPISDLDELDRVRQRLREEHIEALVIRVVDQG